MDAHVRHFLVPTCFLCDTLRPLHTDHFFSFVFSVPPRFLHIFLLFFLFCSIFIFIFQFLIVALLDFLIFEFFHLWTSELFDFPTSRLFHISTLVIFDFSTSCLVGFSIPGLSCWPKLRFRVRRSGRLFARLESTRECLEVQRRHVATIRRIVTASRFLKSGCSRRVQLFFRREACRLAGEAHEATHRERRREHR